MLLLISLPAAFSGMFVTPSPKTIEPDQQVADTLLTTEFVKNPTGDAYDYIRELSLYMELPEEDLFSLIYFETGGTMNPVIKNPNSSAGGVLQFTNSSARILKDSVGIHYKSTDDLLNRCSTMKCQLAVPGKTTKYGGPVYQYLSRFTIKSKQDLFMAVFYPEAIGKGPNYILPKSVQGLNNGIHSVEEYVRRVEEQIASLR